MLEAIAMCQQISGREMNWQYGDENRKGDHIWWISDIRKFQSHYPGYELQFDSLAILREIHDRNRERWKDVFSSCPRMSAVKKRNILGILIDDADAQTATGMVIDAAHRGGPFSVSAIAVHGVMEGVLDPAHLYRLNSFELVVADGQPVRWALNHLHSAGLRVRVYGPNLMLSVLARAEQEKLLGLPLRKLAGRAFSLNCQPSAEISRTHHCRGQSFNFWANHS